MVENENPPIPQFCMPLVGQNLHKQLVIPRTFFTMYVSNGERYLKAMLQTTPRRGKTKVWEVWMKEGTAVDKDWSDFVKGNDLKEGDILVFRYEGDLLFHVFIFDPDTAYCGRECVDDIDRIMLTLLC